MMTFSNIIKCSINQIDFSPDNLNLAYTQSNYLIIYKLSSTKEILKFKLPNSMTHLKYSPDSSLIILYSIKSNSFFIQNIENTDWTLDCNDIYYGISNIIWFPNSRDFIIFNSLCTYAYIYSVSDFESAPYIIDRPKFSDKGLSFSNNKEFFALLEKSDSKDKVSIFYIGNYECLISFICLEAFDIQDIQFRK